MVDYVTQRSVAQAPPVAAVGQPAPDPLTGGVGAGGSGAVTSEAEAGDHRSGNEAGPGAGHQRPAQRGDGTPRRTVLLVGGYGLIGNALAHRLLRDGHEVILAVRRADAAGRIGGLREVHLDYSGDPDPGLLQTLEGVDVVANTAGVFAERAGASFDDVHVYGPCKLFTLAARAGVARVIQVSALGAAPDAPTAYWRSKAGGDACAWEFPGVAVVVRPSLVFAEAGASTAWFLRLASMPWLPLPDGGQAAVQPIHLDDLVDGLAALVTQPNPPRELAAVGPQPMPLADYLRALALPLGLRPRITGVPAAMVRALLPLAGRISSGMVDADSLRMLEAGSCADPTTWRSLLGRELRYPGSFTRRPLAPALRQRATLANLVPLLRVANSAIWLVTAWVSLFVFPREASIELLLRSQVPGVLAPAALMGAALLDAVLGLAMWVGRWRRAVYWLQLGLMAFYTVVITVWLPEFWAHPYGPVLKNLAVLGLILVLLRLEEPGGLRHR